jgi:hypothetical protein
VLLESEPEESFRLFDDLLAGDPASGANAINRFAAENNCARKMTNEVDRVTAFKAAITHWQQAAERLSQQGLATVQRNASYNMLVAFNGAKLNVEFVETWKSLPRSLAVEIDFLRVAVNHAIQTEEFEWANQILGHARSHHLETTGQPSAEFETLLQSLANQQPTVQKTLVSTGQAKESIEALQIAFRKIMFDLRLDEFVRVTGQDNPLPQRFLTEAFLEASKKFLNLRILSLREKFNEDELSSFLLGLLEMRLGMHRLV